MRFFSYLGNQWIWQNLSFTRFKILLLCALLTACNSSSVPTDSLESNQQFNTAKPAMLRSLDDTELSVIVRLNNAGPDYTGEQQADDSWVVRLDIELDTSHTFVASWYGRVDGQNMLLLEQQGEFFASSTSMFAQAIATPTSAGAARFDADCDGDSNLFEVDNGFDPLSEPGCAISSAENTTTDTSTDIQSDETNSQSPTPSSTFPDMVEIPAGCFLMGNALTGDPKVDVFFKEDQRQHQVCLQAFSMGRYEVTFDQYAQFADSPGTPESVPGDLQWGKGTRPVRDVTWREAVAYTQWLSEQTQETYRLPTEAEWEYAARGGTTTRFWTGDVLRDDEEHFNSSDPYGGGVATGQPDRDRSRPVGSLKPNPYGLYDMLGNLIEHTCSEYSEDYSDNLETQCGDPEAEHVVRGAAYNYIASWAHVYHRTSMYGPDAHNGHVGFRVVRENR